ncbi:hypothetical protein HYU17_02265 [Candidatus Woesearchaeota archaeon]|nr:hypothetical protein [Candidatus Woesearchaeota archaeon]
MRSSLRALWLYVFLFIALLPVLFFAFYFGILPTGISGLDLSAIATIAMIVLLALPVVFVFLGVAVLAARMAKRKPVRYPWEAVFPEIPESVEEAVVFRKAAAAVVKPVKPAMPKTVSARPKAAEVEAQATGAKAAKEILVISLFAAVILLIFLVRVTPGVKDVIFGHDSNATKASVTDSNVTAGIAGVEKEAKLLNATGNASKFNASDFFAPFASKAKALPGLPQKLFRSVKALGSKAKKGLAGLAGNISSRVSRMPERAWQGAAAAALAAIFISAVFYSYKSGSLGQAVSWCKGWIVWLAFVFGLVRKNKLKLLLGIVAVAVIAASVAAFVFREWLKARLPVKLLAKLPRFPKVSGITDAVAGFLSAASGFLSAYRLYILIGIFALLIVIAFLFFLERRGKGGNASR